jgi:hypothetical protein
MISACAFALLCLCTLICWIVTPVLPFFADARTRGNDTSIVCLSPANPGSARWFDIVVVVGNVPSTYLVDQWQYLPPVVSLVQPATLAPNPMNATLTVLGTDFGDVPGRVTLGHTVVVCFHWSRGRILCVAPSGVAASAPVVVTRPGGQSSNPTSPAALVSFRAPVVLSLSLRVVGTRGGVPLTVVGSDFATPLPVTVWLLPAGAEPGVSAPWLVAGARQCPVVATGLVVSEKNSTVCGICSVSSVSNSGSGTGSDSGSSSDSSSSGGAGSLSGRLILHNVTCSAPAGAGVNWAVAVVNHGTPVEGALANASLSQWQVSGLVANATVDYLPPSLTTVSVVTAATWRAAAALTDDGADPLPATAPARPRIGGFLVLVRGSNLGSTPPVVLVTGRGCEPLPEPGAASHEHVVCVAPAMSLGVPNEVNVVQAGQRSASVEFLFDPPEVRSVQPGVVDAVGRCVSGCFVSWFVHARASAWAALGSSAGFVGAKSAAAMHSFCLLDNERVVAIAFVCLACREDGGLARSLALLGANFGVPSATSDASLAVHVVRVGDVMCVNVQWESDGIVRCTLLGAFAVGSYQVSYGRCCRHAHCLVSSQGCSRYLLARRFTHPITVTGLHVQRRQRLRLLRGI